MLVQDDYINSTLTSQTRVGKENFLLVALLLTKVLFIILETEKKILLACNITARISLVWSDLTEEPRLIGGDNFLSFDFFFYPLKR